MTTPFAELEPLTPLMDKCVHCGFCLSTCPSYLLLGQEMDSPRGRIVLMKAGLEGRASLTAPVVEHFDTCLGCMACETACPSGVRYAPAHRAHARGHRAPPLTNARAIGCSGACCSRCCRIRRGCGSAAWPLALVGCDPAVAQAPARAAPVATPRAHRRSRPTGGRARRARAHAGRGRTAAARRSRDRLRPAGVLRRRQREHRARAGRRGLRRRRAGQRRAAAARSRSTPGRTRTRARMPGS